MGRQRGGSVTLNYEFSAEDLLDRFSDTYFEKHDIELSPGIYEALYKFLHVGEDKGLSPSNNNTWFWFNQEDNEYTPRLLLEDKYLNFDEIEKRLYNALSKKENGVFQERNGVEHRVRPYVMHFAKPNYIFREEKEKIFHNIVPALNPFIRKVSSNPVEWKLYIRIDGRAEETVYTSNQSEPKNAIVELIKKYADTNQNLGDQGQVSGCSQGGRPITDMSKIHLLQTNDKLIMHIENQRLSVYYAEKQKKGNNERIGEEWKFHPHNLTEFLPSTYYEKQFKKLYMEIQKKLDAIKDDPHFNYTMLPDGFFHIHVGYIPNEEAILLTVHGLAEINWKSEENGKKFSEYIYENNKGRYSRKREKSIERNNFPGHLNSESNRADAEVKHYVNLRKGHNAYILVKPNTSHHPLYRFSDETQTGNPFFLFPDYRTNVMMVEYGIPMASPFALDNNAFALTKYDINHMLNKGIQLCSSGGSCKFCNLNSDIPVDGMAQDFQRNITKLIRASSNPITKNNLQGWKNRVMQAKANGKVSILNSYNPAPIAVSQATATNNNKNNNNYNLTRLVARRKTRKNRH